MPQEGEPRPGTVVFVESAGAMGGVQFSTLYLAQRLNRALWKPIVVCPEEGDLTRACADAEIETHVLAHPRLWSTSVRIGRAARLPNPVAWTCDAYAMSRAARRLKNLLFQCSPDLVVTKGLSSHFVGGLAARGLGIPCAWHVQDFISERFFGIYRSAFSWCARWLPQQIIVDGKTIQKQLPRSLRSRVTVIHNGVDTNIFRPGLDGASVREEFGIPTGHLVVGHVGRTTPWKGQHYLIEAFAQIANENPNVCLLLVGAPVFDNDSYERRLLNMVAQLGLKERVKFAGYRSDLPRMLAAMDIFAFTSIEKDTSPLALLSAMSCGLPIVAFDIEGVRELMANQDQLLLVPVGQIDGLVRSLTKLITDQDLRNRLAACTRQQAEMEFSLDQYVSRVERVFLKTLGTKRTVVTNEAPPKVNRSASEV